MSWRRASVLGPKGEEDVDKEERDSGKRDSKAEIIHLAISGPAQGE